MSRRKRAAWERECAVAALAGQQLCPRYGMPCWVCCLLHVLTGTLRSVTEGRFDRFEGHSIFKWVGGTADRSTRWVASPGLICPHHRETVNPEYLGRHGQSYWYHDVSDWHHENTHLGRHA